MKKGWKEGRMRKNSSLVNISSNGEGYQKVDGKEKQRKEKKQWKQHILSQSNLYI